MKFITSIIFLLILIYPSYSQDAYFYFYSKNECFIIHNEKKEKCKYGVNSLKIGDKVKSSVALDIIKNNKKNISIISYGNGKYYIYEIQRRTFTSFLKNLILKALRSVGLDKYQTNTKCAIARSGNIENIVLNYNPKFSLVSPKDTLIFSLKNSEDLDLYIEFYIVYPNKYKGNKATEKIYKFKLKKTDNNIYKSSIPVKELISRLKAKNINLNDFIVIKWELKIGEFSIDDGIFIITTDKNLKDIDKTNENFVSDKEFFQKLEQLSNLCLFWRMKYLLLENTKLITNINKLKKLLEKNCLNSNK